MRRTIHTLIAIALALAGALTASSAYAQEFVPNPCDFITGGGWVLADPPTEKVNFGVHGGCKNGAFWGHVNVVHHGFNPPARLRSTRITGYLVTGPNQRDICGEGEVDGGEGSFPTRFRVRLQDNGEPGGLDTFALLLTTPTFPSGLVLISPRDLGPPGETGGGGNIKLHKEGRSPAPTQAECIPVP